MTKLNNKQGTEVPPARQEPSFPFSSSHSIHTVIIRLRLFVVFMNLPNHHSAIRMLKPCDRVRQVARPAARPSCLSRISCTPSQSHLRGLPSHDRAATAALIKVQLRCAAGRSRSVVQAQGTAHWTPLRWPSHSRLWRQSSHRAVSSIGADARTHSINTLMRF